MIKNRDIHKASNGKNSLIILSLILLLIALSGLAFAIPGSLTLQGKLTNLAGTSQVGAFNFSFKIYDAYTGGNRLYESNINLTTDANGIYDVVLQNLSSLNFSEQYYLGITVMADNEMEPRVNLTSAPYSFRANISEALNRENKYEIAVLNVTGNLTLGQDFDDVLSVTTGRLNISDGNIVSGGNLTLSDRINFRFNQIIDNLVSGFLRISGNLNVTGNVSIAQNTLFVDNTSGKVGIGTASPTRKLDVAGDVTIYGNLNVSLVNATTGNFTGTVQAARFVGDGSLLTGITGDGVGTTFNNENLTGFLGVPNSSIIRTENVSSFVRTGDGYTLTNFTSNLNAANASISLWNISGSNIFQREISGNLGIGITVPSSKLEVAGTFNATQGTTSFRVTSDNNILIHLE